MPKVPTHVTSPSSRSTSQGSQQHSAGGSGPHTNNERNATHRATPYSRDNNPAHSHDNRHSSSSGSKKTSHPPPPPPPPQQQQQQQQQQNNHPADNGKVDEDDFDDIEIPEADLEEEGSEEDDFDDIQLTQEELDTFDDRENDDDGIDEIEEDGFDEVEEGEFGESNVRSLTQPHLASSFAKAGAEARARNSPSRATTTTNVTPARAPPPPPPPHTSNGPNGQITSQQSYTAFLERLKTGQEPTITHCNSRGTTYSDLVRIPDQFLFTPVDPQGQEVIDYKQARRQFLLEIYPDLAAAPTNSRTMMENVVLVESSKDAEEYNTLALKIQQPPRDPSPSFRAGARRSGVTSHQERTYIAISAPLNDDDYLYQDMVTADWLNPQDMPPHTLFLRVGHPVILLKDLGPGFPAGTRLIVRRLNDFSISVEATLGLSAGQTITIPRMTIRSPNARDAGCLFTRHQIPVRHAFAFSLGNAVGKGFRGLVGVDLRTPVGRFRQLYFLLACCGDYRGLKVYVGDGEVTGRPGRYTRNPV